jgi:hypothetical protein
VRDVDVTCASLSSCTCETTRTCHPLSAKAASLSHAESSTRDLSQKREAVISESHFFSYPSEMNRVTDKEFTHNRLTVYTRLYRGSADGVSTAAEPKPWDLILGWPPQADAKLVPGMSGCGVWEIQPDTDGPWIADRAIRPVAVDTAMVPGRWFRTTTWDAVKILIDDAEAKLSKGA